MREQSDESLIEQARRGDSAAFAGLVERHYASIFRIAWKWCGDRADAEDIAQDVCMKLAQAISGFKGDAAFTSWLYRITLNAVRDFQRARARRSDHVMALARDANALAGEGSGAAGAAGVSAGDLASANPDGDLTSGELWRTVQRLPDKQRDAVLLIYAEGLSHAEAARVLDCAESTVSWHIHEAKKRLKGLLEGAQQG